jgi:putative transposase
VNFEVGDQVVLDEVEYRIAAVASDAIALHNAETGRTTEMMLRDFQLSAPSLISGRLPVSPAADLATLSYLGQEESQQARFWLDCLTRLEAEIAKAPPRSTEPAKRMLDFLAQAGHPITLRTLQRKRSALASRGVIGLVDKRRSRTVPRQTDPRVVAALSEVMGEQTYTSTGTATRLIVLTEQALDRAYGRGAPEMPSARTMHRLINEIDAGRHTLGSAKTRRSAANTPDRQHTPRPATRPGEQVQIDTTDFDVMLRMPDGKPGRAELTIMLDVACRAVPAAILRPTTKSTDLVVLLARALVPYDNRPGGRAETRELADEAFTGKRLPPEPSYAAHRAQVPYIFPETLVTDRGKVYLSRHFEHVCAQLGISLVNSASYTPTDKGKVERMFKSINTLFAQYFKGYTGRSVEHRGTDADEHPEQLHTIEEAQELLDQWIAEVWQNRPHKGLRDPRHPATTLTPNEMCAALRAIFPEIEVPFDSDTYLSLLPTRWLTIQPAGVQVDNRFYDSAALRPLRKTKSRHADHDGAWPIHVDPYNIQTVWLRTDDGLLPLQWANAAVSGPMSADLWNSIRRSGIAGRRKATDLEIAQRGRELLEKAGAGSPAENRAASRSAIVNNDPVRLALVEAVPATQAAAEPATTPAAPEPPELPKIPRRRLELLAYTDE